MNKAEFTKELDKALAGLTAEERNTTLSYYGEIIDDRMESGVDEAEAIAELERPDEIAARILAESDSAPVVKPKRSKLNIALLIIGSPLWLCLLLAGAAIVLALYIAVWAIIIALLAVELAFAVAGGSAIIMSAGFFISGRGSSALFILGCGLVLAALAVLLFSPIVSLVKQLAGATARYTASAWKTITKKLGRV